LALGQLGLSQLEAARLLGVKSRTIQRWVLAIRRWENLPPRLCALGVAWRSTAWLGARTAIPSANEDFRHHRSPAAAGHRLGSMIRRVASGAGPKKRWRINLKRRRAMAGSISVTFNTLANGGFCPASYRRLDTSTNHAADVELIEEAIVAFAEAVATAGRIGGPRHGASTSRTPTGVPLHP